jgi:hypothetical protein
MESRGYLRGLIFLCVSNGSKAKRLNNLHSKLAGINAEILQGRGPKDPPSTRQLNFTLEIEVNELARIPRGYIKQTITHQRLR